MKVNDCFKKGLLRKSKIDDAIIFKEIENAYRHLDNANKCLIDEMYDLAVVSIYTSMFHAARSLLFRDGIKERSHVCVVGYLQDKYPDLSEYIAILDNYRRSRHTMLYGIEEPWDKIILSMSLRQILSDIFNNLKISNSPNIMCNKLQSCFSCFPKIEPFSQGGSKTTFYH